MAPGLAALRIAAELEVEPAERAVALLAGVQRERDRPALRTRRVVQLEVVEREPVVVQEPAELVVQEPVEPAAEEPVEAERAVPLERVEPQRAVAHPAAADSGSMILLANDSDGRSGERSSGALPQAVIKQPALAVCKTFDSDQPKRNHA